MDPETTVKRGSTMTEEQKHYNVDPERLRLPEAGLPRRSRRGTEWLNFSGRVLNHIETYTVPQYGDEPNDQVSRWSAEDCVRQIERYAARHGRSARPGQEALDLLKIAHYAGLAYAKLLAGQQEEDRR